MIKKLVIIILFLSFFISDVKAEERTDFIEDTKVLINNKATSKLNDNDYTTYVNITKDSIITINSNQKFDKVYIIYYLKSTTGLLKYDNNSIPIGKDGFLHEYVELNTEVNSIELKYDNSVNIKEIFLFNGDKPEWVQKWNKPHTDADILLFSTHSDDEHLFFGGLIPKMVADGKKMQVVYVVSHDNRPLRLDEQLNGLWAAGLRNYPVLGVVPDKFSNSLKGAITNLTNSNMTVDDVVKFQVDMIRRFKPEVVVGHDEKGEYGHGQHILNTYSLKKALEFVNDPNYASNYKPFMPYKVYLHLYSENPILMDYDIPLDYFNGKTAYEMSKLGYAEHKSQQSTWFTKWFTGVNHKGVGTPYKSMKEIKKMKSPYANITSTFSPLEYGLYYSRVGYENINNDMFYNIPQSIIEKIFNNINTQTNKLFKILLLISKI